MHIRSLFLIFLILGFLPACATIKRGASETIILTSIPEGAQIETSVVIGSEPTFSAVELGLVERGKINPPKLTFFACPSTPCTLDVPRKRDFEVLISKDGYVSERHYIDFIHRKDLAKRTQIQTLASTTVVGAGAGALGASAIASFTPLFSLGTASASTGAMAAGATLAALPVAVVGAASLGVDSSTGANYDYWPNPATTELKPAGTREQEDKNALMKAQFLKDRRDAILHPRPTKNQRIAKKRADKAERIARLKSKGFYVGVPTREEMDAAVPLTGEKSDEKPDS